MTRFNLPISVRKHEIQKHFLFLIFRCKIPGCDLSVENNNYNQSWLRDAIPYKHGRPAKCLRYKSTVNSNLSELTTTPGGEQSCPAVTFDRSQVIQCNEFIFKTNEHRISKEVNSGGGFERDGFLIKVFFKL